MGCGASTSVDATPGNEPQEAPTLQRVSVAEQDSTPSQEQPTPKIVTQSSNESQETSDTGHSDADLKIEGHAMKDSNHLSVDDDDDDDDDMSDRMASATSTRSAPSIMQRPSSRGGSAFDIQFDDDTNAPRRMPRRLEKLQHRGRAKKSEMTLEQLQKKLEAAERRRRDYEKRLKDKMSALGKKPENTPSEQDPEAAKKIDEEVNRAEEKRQAQLQQLKDRLKEKEEHARKVRERAAQRKKEQQDAQA